MSDAELDYIYKRYKLVQTENDDRGREMEIEAEKLLMDFRFKKAYNEEGRLIKNKQEMRDRVAKVFQTKQQRKKFSHQIETEMAKIRMQHEMNKIKTDTVYNLYDPNFPNKLP